MVYHAFIGLVYSPYANSGHAINPYLLLYQESIMTKVTRKTEIQYIALGAWNYEPTDKEKIAMVDFVTIADFKFNNDKGRGMGARASIGKVIINKLLPDSALNPAMFPCVITDLVGVTEQRMSKDGKSETINCESIVFGDTLKAVAKKV